jgi:hypothetical protein
MRRMMELYRNGGFARFASGLAVGPGGGEAPSQQPKWKATWSGWHLALAVTICIAASAASAAVSGTKGALIMLVSLTDAPIDCTIGEVNGFFFTNSPLNVDSYFSHSTWGSVRWTGSVVSVSVNFPKSPCSQDAWADAADAAATAQGFNPGSYTARIYAFPSAAGSCGYALAAGNRVMNWHCTDLFAYGHEVGHTIGMHHASTDHNNDGVIENEYGGLDDCMGGESYTHNAPHKIWGGWLPKKPANGGWREVETNGLYQISPLEINPTNNPPFSQALKIIAPTGYPYFLSYRQPLDYDQGWTAAQVGKDGRSGTIVDPTPSIATYPYASGVTIHRHSGGSGIQTLEIAVLADNQQFVIPGTGIVVKQNSHDANQVTLSISGVGGGVASNGVTFFQDTGYGGSQSQVISAGNYTLSQLIGKGVPNDWASSMKIPNGWTVIMYQDDNFAGTSWTNSANAPNFTALSPNANDALSSCKIQAGAGTVPPIPTDVSAAAGSMQVTLSWSATPGATNYHVNRATISGGPYEIVGSPAVSGYVDTGLTNGTTYYYVISAQNAFGESGNSAQVSATPTSDLVAHWKFDENSGLSAADSSGNNNTGSLVNAPIWVAPGKLGPSCLLFNAGMLESVTAPSSSSLNNPVKAITIAAWILANDWGGNRRIVQKGNSDNQYRLLAENGVFKLHLNGVDTVTSPLPPTGVWVHVAGTWDGSIMAIYTNGVQQASLAAAGTIVTTADLLAIGKKNTSGFAGDYFNGRIDDVRIYNRALSGAELGAIMTNSRPVFTSNPFSKPDALAGQNYSGTIATSASDPNGDALTFSKLSGPAWLSIAGNGALSGMPLSADVATNSFTVQAADPAGLTNTATMRITVTPAPPINLVLSLDNTNIVIDWNGGIPPYQVQTITNLGNMAWEDLGGPIQTNRLVLLPTNSVMFFRVLGR